jgi:hypothetical protein
MLCDRENIYAAQQLVYNITNVDVISSELFYFVIVLFTRQACGLCIYIYNDYNVIVNYKNL